MLPIASIVLSSLGLLQINADFMGGAPYIFSQDLLAGSPSGVLPVSTATADFGQTIRKKDSTAGEKFNTRLNALGNAFGGGADNVANARKQRDSSKKKQNESEKRVAEERGVESESGPGVGGHMWNALKRRAIPKIFTSSAELISGLTGKEFLGVRKSKASALGALVGYSGKIVSLNDVLDSDFIPQDRLAQLRADVAQWKKTQTPDSPIGELEAATKVQDELDDLEAWIDSVEARLRPGQQQQLEDIRLAVLALMYEGKVTKDEVIKLYDDTN